jgi:hypothetical protein
MKTMKRRLREPVATKALYVMVEEKQWDKIDALAAEGNLSLAAYVRDLIDALPKPKEDGAA